MDYFTIATILIVLSAAFGYINIRFIKLPSAIGLMFITILFTLAVLGLSYFDDTLLVQEKKLISSIDFKSVLLDIMLSFLLFAGALHTNFAQLKKQLKPIIAFATIGTLLSTFLSGTLVYFLLQALSFNVDFIYCLLFGALISPTDPIAVLGILKKDDDESLNDVVLKLENSGLFSLKEGKRLLKNLKKQEYISDSTLSVKGELLAKQVEQEFKI